MTIVLAGLFTALSAALTGASYWMARAALEEQARDKLQQLAVNSMYDVDRLFAERLASVSVMATDAVLSSRNSTAQRITLRLLQLKAPYPDYFSISFFNMDRVRLADTRGRFVGERHGFTEYWPAIAHGGDVFMLMSLSESGEPTEPYIHFVARVKDGKGAPIGVLVARVPVSSLAHAVRGVPGFSEEERRRLEVDIVDRDGRVVFSNYNPKREFQDVSPDWAFVKRRLALGELAGTERIARPGETDGLHAFAAEPGYRSYRGSGWSIIFNLPASVAFTRARELRDKMIAAAAATDLAALLVLLFAARGLSRRFLEES